MLQCVCRRYTVIDHYHIFFFENNFWPIKQRQLNYINCNYYGEKSLAFIPATYMTVLLFLKEYKAFK